MKAILSGLLGTIAYTGALLIVYNNPPGAIPVVAFVVCFVVALAFICHSMYEVLNWSL